MANKIRIIAGDLEMQAELNGSATARAVLEALPVEAEANTWGEEIYFALPVTQPIEATAVDVVAVGDLGYWPTGNAFCIFFGPTPMSRGNEIRPASAVNPIGKVLGDAELFKQVRPGDRIRLEIDS